MKIVSAPKKTKPPVFELKSLKPKDVFYFAHDLIEEVLLGDDGPALFMVIDGVKEERVTIFDLKSGVIMKRDGTHKVTVVECELQVAQG